MASITYKCPNCGGGLVFDPASQQFHCEYCISDFTKEQLEELNPAQEAARTVVYQCPSCGAEVVTEETTAATFCFYCHNPVVLLERLEGAFEPDGVVPFVLTREEAVKRFTDWIRKKRYVPNAFFSKDQIETMTGIYFPYWLYSCQVDGQMEADASKVRVWRSGRMEYTETKRFQIRRQGSLSIRNMTKNALKRTDKRLVEGVLPFQFDKMQPYVPGYLSGFLAEKRDMEQAELAQGVEQEALSYAQEELQGEISGYTSVSVRDRQARIQDPQWKYVLLPVWTLTYRERENGKIYYFACNGQTGAICGELPVDKRKLTILFGQIFVPLLAILLAVGYWL